MTKKTIQRKRGFFFIRTVSQILVIVGFFPNRRHNGWRFRAFRRIGRSHLQFCKLRSQRSGMVSNRYQIRSDSLLCYLREWCESGRFNRRECLIYTLDASLSSVWRRREDPAKQKQASIPYWKLSSTLRQLGFFGEYSRQEQEEARSWEIMVYSVDFCK